MNEGADFFALYRELGVAPECDPDTFKRAYRKRVSGLHPDRAGRGSGGEEMLKTLNYAYSAAIEFHRAHGRFPGALARAMPAAAPAMRIAPPADPEPEVDSARTRSHWRSAASLGLLVALAAVYLSPDDDRRTGAARVDPLGEAAERGAHRAPGPSSRNHGTVLRLGMTPEQVVSLMGPPFGRADAGEQWLYGASWVRVVCGQVVDWYSSPLQPLKVANYRPSHEDAPADYRPRRHCVASTR